MNALKALFVTILIFCCIAGTFDAFIGIGWIITTLFTLVGPFLILYILGGLAFFDCVRFRVFKNSGE